MDVNIKFYGIFLNGKSESCLYLTVLVILFHDGQSITMTIITHSIQIKTIMMMQMFKKRSPLSITEAKQFNSVFQENWSISMIVCQRLVKYRVVCIFL